MLSLRVQKDGKNILKKKAEKTFQNQDKKTNVG
jgi:hypothetical protein